ncbi:hypothetical protein PTKIN_Ptkin02bG0130300 [Pterospermum kingtungense]
MVERKLFKTRLCVLYQRGHCSRQSCSFAHGDAELRRLSGSYSGKKNYRDGDLRDKLDRRLSPERRYSPGRDLRDQRIVRGYSPLRSIDKMRNRKKKEGLDGQSDFSENLKISHGIEDQLKEVRLDINMLIHQKRELEIFVEEKVQEADILTSQVKELDSQLEKEKEEHKRITSKIKKFVKAHKHCSQLEDELKRSQARLQKLGEQLGLNISGTSGDEENSNIDIVSDGETNGLHMSYPPKEKRGKGCQAETTRLGKRSRWSEHPTQSNMDKENGSLNSGNSGAVPLASNEKLRKGKEVSVGTSTADKLKGAHAALSLPSTSMAAHADAVDDDEVLDVEEEDEVEVSGLPFLLPLPPPILKNGYLQYQGEGQNVDVDRLEEETVHVDIV